MAEQNASPTRGVLRSAALFLAGSLGLVTSVDTTDGPADGRTERFLAIAGEAGGAYVDLITRTTPGRVYESLKVRAPGLHLDLQANSGDEGDPARVPLDDPRRIYALGAIAVAIAPRYLQGDRVRAIGGPWAGGSGSLGTVQQWRKDDPIDADKAHLLRRVRFDDGTVGVCWPHELEPAPR